MGHPHSIDYSAQNICAEVEKLNFNKKETFVQGWLECSQVGKCLGLVMSERELCEQSHAGKKITLHIGNEEGFN